MGSGASLVQTIEMFGNITSNRQLYDILPRIIRNTGPIPSFGEILFSNIDLVMVVVSVFILLRVLVPNTMKFKGGVFWFLIISFLLIPTLASIVFLIIRQANPDGKGEDGVIMPSFGLALSSIPILFILYIAWPLVSITGFEVGILYTLLWAFVFIPLSMGFVILSKSIAPILVLLLGPGVIPYLANQSFFEFCS
jgi:hypothetical protein